MRHRTTPPSLLRALLTAVGAALLSAVCPDVALKWTQRDEQPAPQPEPMREPALTSGDVLEAFRATPAPRIPHESLALPVTSYLRPFMYMTPEEMATRNRRRREAQDVMHETVSPHSPELLSRVLEGLNRTL